MGRDPMKLMILGISSATPTLTRHPSAQVLDFGAYSYMIDCGEGTQVQCMRYGVKMSRLSRIFISHLHPDHYLGLLGILSTLNLQGRRDPLTIFAPKGLQEIIEIQFQYGRTSTSYPLEFIELQEGTLHEIHRSEYMQIEAFSLEHRLPCWGFRFTQLFPERRIIKQKVEGLNLEPEAYQALRNGKDYVSGALELRASEYTFEELPKTFAYITDTLFLPELAIQLRGTQNIYHEATYLHESHAKATDFHHSTAREAAEFAKIAEASQLILGHYSARYDSLEPLLEEAKSVFIHTKLGLEGEIYLL